MGFPNLKNQLFSAGNLPAGPTDHGPWSSPRLPSLPARESDR